MIRLHNIILRLSMVVMMLLLRIFLIFNIFFNIILLIWRLIPAWIDFKIVICHRVWRRVHWIRIRRHHSWIHHTCRHLRRHLRVIVWLWWIVELLWHWRVEHLWWYHLWLHLSVLHWWYLLLLLNRWISSRASLQELSGLCGRISCVENIILVIYSLLHN